MKRRSKIALGLAPVVLVLLATPVIVLLAAPMTYFPLVEQTVRSATGFDLRVEDMDVALFPVQVSLRGVELANPAFETPLLTARNMAATAWLGDYLGEEPTWWRASAAGVDVRLEQDAEGNSNWEIAATEEPALETGPNPALEFSLVELSEVTVLRISEQEHRFEVDRLRLERAADERLLVDVDGRYNDQPLQAAGTLALPSSERATEVDFRARVFGGTVNVDGRVGHDGITPGRARIVADFDDLAPLGVLLDQDLAFLEPIALNGTLAAPEAGRWQLEADGELAGRALHIDSALDVDGQLYRLQRLALTFGSSSLEASGRADLAQRRLQGHLDADRIDADELMRLQPAGEAVAEAETPSGARAGEDAALLEVPPGIQDWNYDLDVAVEALTYQGSRLAGLTLAIHDEQEAVVFDGGLATVTLSQAQGGWRLVEPVKAAGRVLLPPPPAAIGGFEADFRTEGLEGHVNVTLPAAAGEQQRVALDARMSSLAAIEGADLDKAVYDDLFPLEADLEAEGGGAAWDLQVSGAGVAGTRFDGQLSIDAGAQPIEIRGKIHSPEIDLNTIPTTAALGESEATAQPDESAASEESAQAAETADDQQGLIPDDPVDWSVLELASVDVAVLVDQLMFNKTNFRDTRTHVRLQDGRLIVEPISASLTRGGVRGHARVMQREGGGEVDVRLVVSQLVPADLGQPDQGLIDGGATDLVLDVRASGRSPQDLASTLTGELALEVQEATVRNDLFERFTGDLLMETLTMVNPFVERDDETELRCAAVHLVAEDGEITSPNRIVIETSKVVIRAGGTLDLDDETMTLDFMPSPRKGLGLSLGGLAEVVRVGGTLSNPQTEANPAGVLKGGAKVAAAIATGGATLIAQGLFARARNLGTECGSIFEKRTDIPQQLRVEEE